MKFSVNWLYRLADEKELAKDVALLEAAAPNQIFYSFHKDDNISAASLLHPCKVVFLGKGVELPSEVFLFVCCHVYNTTSKCLWWLTDRDYINVRSFFVPTPSSLLTPHVCWYRPIDDPYKLNWSCLCPSRAVCFSRILSLCGCCFPAKCST